MLIAENFRWRKADSYSSERFFTTKNTKDKKAARLLAEPFSEILKKGIRERVTGRLRPIAVTDTSCSLWQE
jgi:hypothetical protein